MKLNRYWLEFEASDDKTLPPGVAMGCGISAVDKEDALLIARTRVFKDAAIPPLRRLVEDVDISTLDANHVRPNMKAPILRGVWFPLGFDE
jgi:hypothetical protein